MTKDINYSHYDPDLFEKIVAQEIANFPDKDPLDLRQIVGSKFRQGESRKRQNCLGFHFYRLEEIDWLGLDHYITEELWKSLGVKAHYGIVHGGEFGEQRLLKYSNIKKKLKTLDIKTLLTLDLRSLENDGKFIPGLSIEEQTISSVRVFSNVWDKGGRGISRAKGFFIIDENILDYDPVIWQNIVSKIYEYVPFAYGYYYKCPIKCHPEYYPAVITDFFSTNLEDYKSAKNWKSFVSTYSFKSSRHPFMLRDIHLLNFVSKPYLEQKLSNDMNLQEWIESDSKYGKINKIRDNFYCWQVEEEMISIIREQLKGSRILVRHLDNKDPILRTRTPESDAYL